jgi:SAM-dependent methyltransferase
VKHGYVTEVAYQPSFHPEQAPATIRLAAALNGFAPPTGEGFAALEAGAGAGKTLAILAAADRDSRFVGFDFMAEHVEAARAFAASGNLENASFLEADLADLAPAKLGAFDYMSAHGVYTWVAPALRARLVDLASACLKPGGLLYVSYNAMPGWAAVQPLRRLLIDVAERGKGSLAERATTAVAFAEHLRAHGAHYFAQNPAAAAMLAEVLKKDVSYVLHEHFNDDSTALSFSEVSRDMQRGDLHFVGQIPLFLNYKDLAIPASALPMFEGTDRGWFETLKDYATNAFFRRDVYRKGSLPPEPAALGRYLDDGVFGTIVPPTDVPRSVTLPHCTMSFSGAIFEALIDALGDAPIGVDAIVAEPRLASFGRARVHDALRSLLIAGVAAPMRARGLLAEPPLLNRALVAGWTEADGPLALASPLTGSGLTVDASVAARLQKGERPREVVRLNILGAG